MSSTASSSKNSKSNRTIRPLNTVKIFFDLTLKLIPKNSAGYNTSKNSRTPAALFISVKDEKMLNEAIEIANGISARSMCDLVFDPAPSNESPKRKITFWFPHLNGHGSSDQSHGSGLSTSGGTGGSNTHMKK